MADRRVKVIFSAEIQNFKAGMAEAAAATQKVKKAAEDAAKTTDENGKKLSDSAKRNVESWNTAGAAAAGFGAATLAGVGVAVKSFADFDKQMSSVQAATHATGGEMSQLRDLAVTLGADTSFSAREAAQGIEELAKAGVSTKDIMGGGLAGALSLAAAGELEVGEAAETAASAMTQFKLTGEDIPHIADLLAAGAGKAQGSVQDMGAALNQAGLIASQTGLSIEETTGGLAAFASAGLTGSDAGTSFKTMLQALTPNSDKAAAAMEELGISAYDSQGNFVGLSEFAGQLKTSLAGLTEEQRNSTLETIFGSDAVRAAAVLYEQGSEGIERWEDAVNSAGYAAETARIKQDNLAGDIEKLGGSIDSVFLKSASGANEVLRGMAQGAENLVDAIGGIPGPILQTSAGIAAVVGSAALAGGAFLTVFPKVMETRAAFNALAEDSPKLAGALGKVGKAATVAAGAFIGLQIVGAISKAMGPAAKTTEEYGQAFLSLDKGTKNLDKLTANLGGLGTQIHGVGDALARRADFNWFDDLNNGLGDLVGGTSKTQEVRDSVIALDETLAGLASNGGAAKAADSFKILAAEADKSAKANGKQGLSIEETLKLMPGYKDALLAQATAAGVTLTDQELLNFAMGKVPDAMKNAEGAAKPAAETIEDVGTAAEQAAEETDKLVESLLGLNQVNISAVDAQLGFDQAIADAAENLKNAGAGVDYLDEATGKFNQTAADNLEMLTGIASQGNAVAQTVYDQTGSYDEFRASLDKSRQSLFDVAKAYYPTEEAAWAYVDSVMAIPPEMKTTVDITDNNSIQGVKDNLVLLHDAIQATPDKTITIKEPLSPAVRKGLEDLGYDVRNLPDGQIQVTERGTDATGAKIDGVARQRRVAEIIASADTWSAEQILNETARPRRSTIFQDVIRTISGDTSAPVGTGTVLRATGGRLPGFADGGQLPTTGPGTDRTDGFLGISSAGVPLARVDAGEWIINRRSSDRYNRELAAINAGTFQKMPGYASGGREYSAQQLGYAPYRSDGNAPRTGGMHVENLTISEQSDPVATFHEFNRRSSRLAV